MNVVEGGLGYLVNMAVHLLPSVCIKFELRSYI